jgi:hypothetical protein
MKSSSDGFGQINPVNGKELSPELRQKVQFWQIKNKIKANFFFKGQHICSLEKLNKRSKILFFEKLQERKMINLKKTMKCTYLKKPDKSYMNKYQTYAPKNTQRSKFGFDFSIF